MLCNDELEEMGAFDAPNEEQKPPRTNESQYIEALKTYDFLGLITNTMGEPDIHSADYVGWSGVCAWCGHNDDLRFYTNTNTAFCAHKQETITAIEWLVWNEGYYEEDAKDEVYKNNRNKAPATIPASISEEGLLPPIVRAIATREKLPPRAPVLIEGILRRGHKLLLSNASKSGKTWMLIGLAEHIACGAKWLGHQCTQGRVLYIDGELASASVQHRIADVCEGFCLPVQAIEANLDVLSLRGCSGITTKVLSNELSRKCSLGYYAAIVIDPIYKFFDGDENRAQDVKQFWAYIDALSKSTGAASICSHHFSKGAQGFKAAQDRASGSGVFARDPDALLTVTELEIDSEHREALYYQYGANTKGYEMSFVLREFPPQPKQNIIFDAPIHRLDDANALEGCTPLYNPAAAAKKERDEKEKAQTLKALDAACLKLYQANDNKPFKRKDLETELGRAINTVKSYLNRSECWFGGSDERPVMVYPKNETCPGKPEDYTPQGNEKEGSPQLELPS